jgi:toxin HigB-1
MIRSFRDKGTCDIAKGAASRSARLKLPIDLHRRARRLIAEIDFASTLNDLSRPANRLHVLTGDRKGQHSIAINMQYRICFRWADGEASQVEITDYH